MKQNESSALKPAGDIAGYNQLVDGEIHNLTASSSILLPATNFLSWISKMLSF